ncbi:hypothetical protein BDV10DRAFT_110356 [Aspergillus recurvatus]
MNSFRQVHRYMRCKPCRWMNILIILGSTWFLNMFTRRSRDIPSQDNESKQRNQTPNAAQYVNIIKANKMRNHHRGQTAPMFRTPQP